MKPALKSSSIRREQIRVRGTVQGVGFRPMVYRLAEECELAGEVFNDAQGVCIRVAGEMSKIENFLDRLHAEVPPLAIIESIERSNFDGSLQAGFRIVASKVGPVRTTVAADATTCVDCLAETFDPANRRYLYPFTNCTHCGPRLSIVRAIPYDRQYTSMDSFPMCTECELEYQEPENRRFHAQPNACHRCGPRIWLEGEISEAFRCDQHPESELVLDEIKRLLMAGKILAIKGLGGFHLACDATNDGAVTRLRKRKHRFEKPFALMARDLDVISQYCKVSSAALALLESASAPIVVMAMTGPDRLAANVAPCQDTYAFMLPYTPLHHLIMCGLNKPIVLTSGNMSEEPQCVSNDDARKRLSVIADVLVLHNRDIINRLDDSVARVISGKSQLLRRARGYAPSSIRLPEGFEKSPGVIAFGGELKNTFCFVQDGQAILSQHLGDLENPAANVAYADAMQLFESLFRHAPKVLAVDLHPEYLSTKLGKDRAQEDKLLMVEIQHHHAHIAACMADNLVPLDAPPVLGIALDGLGYGDDGTLWGGEFMLTDYRSYRRVGTFESIAMPGGTKAIIEPWRMAFAYLHHLFDWKTLTQQYAHLPFFSYVASKPIDVLRQAILKNLNCPRTSACGRLFDAVSSATGLRQQVSYEAQGAIELEALLGGRTHEEHKGSTIDAYRLEIDRHASLPRIGTKPMWAALLEDLDKKIPTETVSRRFHQGLAKTILEMVNYLTKQTGNPWQSRVALSGGVFQNIILTELIVSQLIKNGYEVYTHQQVPTNDGGISLGQAAVASARALST